MAENPLLPDEQLRALLALTRRCAKLEANAARTAAKRPSSRKGAAPALPSREALLAASTLQLQPGDLMLPEMGDTAALSLAPAPTSTPPGSEPLLPALGRQSPRLLLAAAMAAALKASGSDRLVLAYTRAGAPELDWAAALRWSQTRLLPLVVVCGDARGRESFRASARSPEGAFTWSAVEALARQVQAPVLSVDGEDAVAVYRVLQESVLRARTGGGPAVVWAMLPSTRELAAGRSSTAAPVRRLERYLRSREIPLR